MSAPLKSTRCICSEVGCSPKVAISIHSTQPMWEGSSSQADKADKRKHLNFGQKSRTRFSSARMPERPLVDGLEVNSDWKGRPCLF